MSISKIWRQVLPLSVIRNVKEVYTSILYPNCLYIAGHICTLLRQNLFRLARFLKFRDTQHRWIRCEWPLCFGIWATILYYFGPVRHRSNFCNRGHRGTVIVNPRIVSIPYHHAGRPNGWKIHWLTRGCFSYHPPPRISGISRNFTSIWLTRGCLVIIPPRNSRDFAAILCIPVR